MLLLQIPTERLAAAQVFEEVGAPLVTAALDGFNATLFAYGVLCAPMICTYACALYHRANRFGQNLHTNRRQLAVRAQRVDSAGGCKFVLPGGGFGIFQSVLYGDIQRQRQLPAAAAKLTVQYRASPVTPTFYACQTNTALTHSLTVPSHSLCHPTHCAAV